MILKPPECRGCPFNSRGKYWVPDEIRNRSRLMILGQNPGIEEEQEGRPFVGKTGKMQEGAFLPLTAHTRDDVSTGNAIRCRVDDDNELPPLEHPETQRAIQHCAEAYFRIPEGCNTILTQGAYALWAMTGEGLERGGGVTDWRGWALPHQPGWMGHHVRTSLWTPEPQDLVVLPSLHLAALFRDPMMTYPTKRDWAKTRKVVERQWPEKLGEVLDSPPDYWPALSAFDTEFTPPTSGAYATRLLRYNLADAKTRQVWVVENDGNLEWPAVQGQPRVILHNAEADLDFLEQGLGGEPFDIEDTMYADSVLWSGLPHGLGFLGSLYARTNRWKHLVHSNPRAYAGGDALGTVDVWLNLEAQLKRDPESERAYRERRLPLVGLIRKARRAGIKVDGARARLASEYLIRQQEEQTLRAQAEVGWPINLNSGPQVAHWLYEVEGLPKPRAKPRRTKLQRKEVK